VIFVLILEIEDPATTCLTVLDLTVIHWGRHDTQHDDIQHKGLFYDTYRKWNSASQQPAIMLSVAIYLLLCWMPSCWVPLCWMSWRRINTLAFTPGVSATMEKSFKRLTTILHFLKPSLVLWQSVIHQETISKLSSVASN